MLNKILNNNYLISFFKILVFYMVVSLCVVSKTHGICIAYGIPVGQFDVGLDYVIFGKWLFMMSIPLLVGGHIFGNGIQIRYFCELRMKRKCDFRLGIAGYGAAVTVLWAMVLVFVAGAAENVSDVGIHFLLLGSNLLMWNMIWQLLLWKVSESAYAFAIMLVIMGGSCLIGQYFPCFLSGLPSFWGMYTVMQEGDFLVMVMRNIVATAITVCMLMMDNKE